MTSSTKQSPNKADAKKLRDEANQAGMTSSPALNDDAQTDSGASEDQHMPDGNRLE